MATTDRRAFDPFAPHTDTAPNGDGQDLDALTGVVQPTADAPADAESVAADEPLPDNLDDLLKGELIALAESRGVDSSGTKAVIIARLRGA